MNMENGFSKILPMKYPLITSYPHHANLLSILSHNEDYLTWFYSHYFQLAISISNDNRLDFNIGYSGIPFIKNCPYIIYHGLSREFISNKWNSFSDFIIDSINCGYYLYFMVDKFYISAYEDQYLRKHRPHDILVYGYDTQFQSVNVADFFKNGKYLYGKCSFSNIEEGFLACNNFDWINGVTLLKERIESGLVDIRLVKDDVRLLKDYIDDYLKSNNSNHRTVLINNWLTDNNYVFGMQVYDVIEKHIQRISSNKDFFDIRLYHVLCDHKKYILLLIKYLFDEGLLNKADYFYKAFNLIKGKTLVLRNLMIKYKISGSKKIIDKAINILKDIAQNEKQHLQEMIKNILDTPSTDMVPSDTSIDSVSLYLEYSEEWNKDAIPLGEYFFTNAGGAWVQLMFYGSSISYIATKDEDCGCADIFIDGIKYDSVDLYSPETMYGSIVFFTDDLPLGYHNIKIICNERNYIIPSRDKITLNKLIIKSKYTATKVENEVMFIGVDNTTKGSWKSIYGRDGYDIVGSIRQIPQFAKAIFRNSHQYVWASKTADERALQISDSFEIRIASCKYSIDNFIVELTVLTEEFKNIAFYLCDFDNRGRMVQVKIFDPDTKKLLCMYDVDNFKEGVYLKYKMKGRLLFNFVSKAWPNAVLSGIFFD